MSTWCPDLAGFSGPKYQAVADALARAVAEGYLHPGDRLPPQRALAARLGFDLTTITRAYDLARERGLIVARGRAGSFVREARGGNVPDLAPLVTGSGMNCPPLAEDGLFQRAMCETLPELLTARNVACLQYQRPGGAPDVRRAGAMLLARAGFPSNEDQVILTAGGQNALHAILHATTRKGDRVACAQFVYPGFRTLARRLSLELVPLPEMTAEALRQANSAGKIQALYVVPTNNNPTTETIGLAQRKALAELARAEGIAVIEDDAYALLADDPIAPIGSFAPECSWYILSMSKVISPALRVAFARAPGVSKALQLAAEVHETAVMAPPLNAAVVARWLADGRFEQIVAATRAEAAARQRLAREILAPARHAGHPQGYHIWLELPRGIRAGDLSQVLNAHGLDSVSSDRFAVASRGTEALRITLGGVQNRDRLAAGLRVLEGNLGAALERWDVLV
ncbi:MAG: hypothetical protein B7Y88_12625 [Sphingomonadales bacterium 32-64-17]|nr:MAG: hypothetical protein B7Y88_12625 [Sphingomonadales bacterium 32-64-17]